MSLELRKRSIKTWAYSRMLWECVDYGKTGEKKINQFEEIWHWRQTEKISRMDKGQLTEKFNIEFVKNDKFKSNKIRLLHWVDEIYQ